jgi:hypothetical protein
MANNNNNNNNVELQINPQEEKIYSVILKKSIEELLKYENIRLRAKLSTLRALSSNSIWRRR